MDVSISAGTDLKVSYVISEEDCMCSIDIIGHHLASYGLPSNVP